MALDIMKVSSLPLEISGAIATDLTEQGYRKERQGEWIKNEYSKGKFYFACSTNCGEALTEVEEKLLPNYCPNCGAKMKGN